MLVQLLDEYQPRVNDMYYVAAGPSILTLRTPRFELASSSDLDYGKDRVAGAPVRAPQTVESRNKVALRLWPLRCWESPS